MEDETGWGGGELSNAWFQQPWLQVQDLARRAALRHARIYKCDLTQLADHERRLCIAICINLLRHMARCESLAALRLLLNQVLHVHATYVDDFELTLAFDVCNMGLCVSKTIAYEPGTIVLLQDFLKKLGVLGFTATIHDNF